MEIKNKYILLAITIAVLFVQFWISLDSYTHDFYARCDSAWYFLGAKGFMAGMRPYVDFTDVKGPLLWLIFGIGHTISNTTYLGIFWVSIVTYTWTIYMCYKTFALFFDQMTSLLASFIMLFFVFNPIVHLAPEAENFCEPAIVTSIYLYVKWLKSREYIDNRFVKISSFLLGILFSWPLLIKFTMSVMLLIVPFMMLCYYIKSQNYKQLILLIEYYAFGAFVLILPFVVYLIYKDSLASFLYEYFIYAPKTTASSLSDTFIQYVHEILTLFCLRGLNFKIIYVVAALSPLLVFKNDKFSKYSLAIASLWFVFLSIHRDMGYYLCASNWVFISFVIALLSHCKSFITKTTKLVILLIIPLMVVAINRPWNHPSFFTKSELRKDYYDCAFYMSQVKRPKMIDYECFDFGLGLLSDALPGCKRFALPYNYLKGDELDQKEAIKKGIPDFIVCNKGNSKYIEDHGYVYYAKYYRWDNNWNDKIEYWLFGRPGLRKPQIDIYPSNVDVLFKKTVVFEKKL